MKTLSGPDLEWMWAEMAHAARMAQPLPEALHELAKANPGTRRGKTAERIAGALSSGKTLPQAVAEDGAFPPGAAEALESGERGGRLETALDSLVESARNESSLRFGIANAVVYPLVIALAALAVMIFFQFRILPLFAQMYREMEIELPGATRLLFGGFALAAFLVTIGPAALVLALYLVPGRLLPFRAVCDWMRLRIPLLGDVLGRFLLAQWCGTMGVLVRAGVPEPQAVRMAGRSTGHAGVEAGSRRLAEEIEKGRPLGEAMEGEPFFPAPLVWMVSSSQKIGGHAGIWPAAEQLYRTQGERLSCVASVVLRVGFLLLALVIVSLTVGALFAPLLLLMKSLGG